MSLVIQRDVAQTTRGRRDWPLVVLALKGVEARRRRILELAYEMRWRLLDVTLYGGALPSGEEPAGAIVDGMPDSPLFRHLLESGCPTVRIGRLPHPDDAAEPVVLEDLKAVGRIGAEHFVERAFRHVAYVGRAPWSDSKLIYEGFKDRAAELGCECHFLQFGRPAGKGVPIELKWLFREKQFSEWIHKVPKPIGLLTFGDSEAARLCMMCEAAGVSVPDQVAVLGHENKVMVCECAQLTLSSVAPDHVGTAETAVRLLHQKMQGEPILETTVLMPPQGIVTRESTDVLATPSPEVARALRYMWDHLASNISVDDVATAAGVSRRKLERAFQRDLNRGINQELLRRRLERSCELLRTTDIPIAELAPAMGFGSKDYFQRVFRKAMGTSPGKWRREQNTG